MKAKTASWLAIVALSASLAALAGDRFERLVACQIVKGVESTVGVEVASGRLDKRRLRSHLRYAEREGNEVAAYRDGEPCQYAIGGQIYGLRHAEAPAALRAAQARLDEAVRGPAAQRITTACRLIWPMR